MKDIKMNNTFSKSKYFENKAKRDPIEEMISWLNSHGIECDDLYYDFCDGVKMCQLVESVTQKSFPMPWVKNPQNVRDKRKNVGAVLMILKNNLYIKPGSVKPDEVVWGDINATYTVLRAINIYMDHGNLPNLPIMNGSRTMRMTRKREDDYEYDENGRRFRRGPNGEIIYEDDENIGHRPGRRRKIGPNGEYLDEYEYEEEDEGEPQKMSRFAVGIDLGTTFTRYSILHDDTIESSPSNVLESAVVFDGDEKVVGVVPISCKNDEQVVIITAMKRIIGRDFSDPNLETILDTLPYKVSKDEKSGRPVVEIPGKDGEPQKYTFEQLTAMLLSHIKDIVSAQMGEEVKDAVISVPAYFTNAQRKATRDAGRIAGLNVLRIVNEPAAAAASYNLKNMGDEARHVVVYDMGGGKLDVSLMHLEGGQSTTVRNAGNTQLGGIDFDRLLSMKLAQDFLEETGIDITKNSIAMRKLTQEAEKAKILLSTQEEVDISIPQIVDDTDLNAHLTREQFEEICESLFEQCTPPLEKIFPEDSEIQRDEIKTIVLSGGSTKIPRVRKIIQDFFGEDVELYDIDENAVVAGLAMQGAIMKGKLKGISIVDTVTLSLGISAHDGGVTVIIPSGSKLPASNTTLATTVKDDQKNVGFDIIEGERPIAADNIKLGHVTITGIQQAARGVPKIEVTMNLDENGILIVTGKDLTTNASVTVSVENKGNLSKEEVDQMHEIAQKGKSTDDLMKKVLEIKTELKYFIERAEKAINDENKIKRLGQSDIEQFKTSLYECKEWFETHPDETTDIYRNKYRDLHYTLNKIMIIQ
ncbi:Heat shock protein SSA3 [Tritrichomonas foetus]|uniref:Heat shock protein SSA3 n=1 Tax=Tritrichomonas foetus TaxID=1144522 RepID=A0A1J4KIF5_9EUKA|nr:Heat shock protein SSA3 [Tritrichomonas foetus]|eukprot:OHT11011.1 Heat shock protein SSA3 [Tritrichomonas foetus]